MANVAVRDLYLDLRSPHGRVPFRIKRVLPDPLGNERGLLRYHHEDLPSMTWEERERERWRLQTAVGHMAEEELARIPPWVFARIALLRQARTAPKGKA